MKILRKSIFFVFAVLFCSQFLFIKADEIGIGHGHDQSIVKPGEPSPFIAKLRSRIENLGLDSYFTSDRQLTRYIESAGYNVARAAAVLARTSRWRSTTGVATIMKWKPAAFLYKHLPYERTGFTDEGNPVIYLPIGKWDLPAVRKAGYAPEVYRYSLRMLEDIRQSLVGLTNPKTGEPVDQAVIVENLDGFNTTNLFPVRNSHILNVYLYLRNIDRHFPFLAKKYLVVRSPLLIQATWMMFRKTAPRLRPRMHVYNRFSIRGPHDLAHSVPMSAIPIELGGTYLSRVTNEYPNKLQ